MTSGNVSEEPIAIENREAVQRLQGWRISSLSTIERFFCAATIR